LLTCTASADECVLNHILQVYHLAPNVVLNVGGSGFSMFQFWPGASPGEATCNVRMYRPSPPATAESREELRRNLFGLMQVVVAEDFPNLPRMQQSFEQSRHAEVLFGRNEPALQNRHSFFAKAVRGR
jgi:hypothetical protein